jgi:hypothetical protein
MPRFRVTTVDRTTTWMSKIFDAESADQARELAESEPWSPEDGWKIECDKITGDCGVETVEEVPDGEE